VATVAHVVKAAAVVVAPGVPRAAIEGPAVRPEAATAARVAKVAAEAAATADRGARVVAAAIGVRVRRDRTDQTLI
jgi:hypothetical protein